MIFFFYFLGGGGSVIVTLIDVIAERSWLITTHRTLTLKYCLASP